MNTLRLKEYRKRLKLTQRDMAERLEMTQANYWLWETGKSFPNAKQILQLCDIFNCTPNDLFGIKGVHRVAISELKDIE